MVLRVCLIVAVAILAVSVLYVGSRPADAKDKVASRGSESPVAGGSGPNSVAISLEEAKHALEYWTPKRMANATPVPLLRRWPSPQGIFDQPLPPNSSSPPVRGAAPVSPSDDTKNGRRQGAGSEVITPAADPPAAETPAEFWVGPGTRPPASTTGKLFATYDFKDTPNDPTDDKKSSCSASTVNSPAKNLVFTAGHCVLNTPKEGDPWSTRDWAGEITFVPDYPSYLYGEWAARKVLVHEEWEKSGDGYDVAAIEFFPSDLTGGERLVDEVGANGIRFNEPAEQDAYAFGYPINQSNGTNLFYCHDRSKGVGEDNPRSTSMKCDFDRGASGGPWLMNFNGEWGDLFSVTSEGCPPAVAAFCGGARIYGPLFDESIGNLYNDIVGTDFPSPGSIAYTLDDRKNDQEIYTMSPTGGTTFQVTNNATDDSDPSYSPNGTSIAYVHDDGHDDEIYTGNFIEGKTFNVTDNIRDDSAPSYSPDGTRIAYESSFGGGDSEIRTISPNGGRPRQVTNNSTNDSDPSYSPDGKKIAYSRRECTMCDTEIYMINSTGGAPFNEIQVTDNDTYDTDPSYSPNGEWIAFSGSLDGNDREIYRVLSPEDPLAPRDEPRQITYNDTNEGEASYSLDANHIVYSSYDGNNVDLYRINLNFGHVRQLTNTDTDERLPSWGLQKTKVPDVVGFYSSGAGQTIRNAGLVPKFTGDPPGARSWVKSQRPSQGTVVDRGSTVTCYLTNKGDPN